MSIPSQDEPLTNRPVAISLPQDVPSTSNFRLIELENQVQRFMKAHVAPTQPPQVNKIITSCEICSDPHDIQYCMENTKQDFVEYASLRTDEPGEDPKTPLLVGRGFLATADAVIDCRMDKIALGEGITRWVFGVKGVDLCEEEAPYWTTLGKEESYKPRPRLDGIGARTPYYARKDFLDYHLPGEWEIARDAELNLFKDTLVFRRMVEFLVAIPINLKNNMWESKDLIKNLINWDKPPKNRDGAWHTKIRLIDPDGEEFTKTLQLIPTIRKLFERESPMEIIDMDHFYDT
uniref:MAK10-like protein n=1 Tax=Tanacetum cinerariifolium TaxID=118510 RepID=A0A6L2JWF0_TANCI|nr:MAK10-like protein [Tanacetum cinerariifolium]